MLLNSTHALQHNTAQELYSNHKLLGKNISQDPQIQFSKMA